jgi:hypothetical protein
VAEVATVVAVVAADAATAANGADVKRSLRRIFESAWVSPGAFLMGYELARSAGRKKIPAR